MHELSLMQGVVRLLHTSAVENNIKKINKVSLIIGKMTAALPDALQFAFEALQQDDGLLADAVLVCKEEPIRGECKECHHVFDVEGYQFLCPSCNGPNVKIVGGRNLYIEFYEGD